MFSIESLAFCPQFVLRSPGLPAISPVDQEDEETGEDGDRHNDDDYEDRPGGGAGGSRRARHGGGGGVVHHGTLTEISGLERTVRMKR